MDVHIIGTHRSNMLTVNQTAEGKLNYIENTFAIHSDPDVRFYTTKSL